jgi:hypothetical protein
MATRIDPKLSEGGRSVFEHRSEHRQFLLSDFSADSHHTDDSIDNQIRTEAGCDSKTLASFFALFPHRNESGVRYSDFTEWRAVSRFHYLTDEEILTTLKIDSNLRRAVRFDTSTQMQVLRIPRESKYFNRFAADLLKKQFKVRGIPIKHYEYNNEWFFYIFFSECVEPAIVSSQLTHMLADAGFTLSTDHLAVVLASDLLPLPVQPGFSWVNERGAVSVRREEISLQGALALFLADVTRNSITFKEYMLRTQRLIGEANRDFSSTTISLLESIGLNVNAQDGVSCFSVFESAQPKAYATTIAVANSTNRATIPVSKADR